MSRAKTNSRAKPDAVAELAAIEIVPWEHTSTPGPSRDQWMAWNNQHGAMLRTACGIMTLSKDKLAEYAREGEGEMDNLLTCCDASIKFFRDMAATIEGAKTRLLIGSAVRGMRLREEKPVQS